jgi:hypothetical protein
VGDFEEWDVQDGTVIEVTLTPKEVIPAARVGIDYSRFRKERTDPQRKSVCTLRQKLRNRDLVFCGKGRLDLFVASERKL